MSTVSGPRLRNLALLVTVATYSVGYAGIGLIPLLGATVVEAVRGTWRWVRTPLDPWLAVLAGVAAASALVSEWRPMAVVPTFLFLLTGLVSIRATAAFLDAERGRLQRLLEVWVAGGLVGAAFGFARALAAPPGARWINWLGTTLIVALVFAAALAAARSGRPRRLAIGAGAVIAVGLVTPAATSAWLGAAAGLLTLAAALAPPAGRRLVAAFAAGAAIVVTAMVVPHLASTSPDFLPPWLEGLATRLPLWRAVPRMVAEHPLLGTGFGTFAFAFPRYRLPGTPDPNPPFAHNIFMNFAVETGLVGLAAFAAVCGAALWTGWRRATRHPPSSPGRALRAAPVAALVGVLVNQQFDGTVMSAQIGFGFFALLAACATPTAHDTPTGEPAGVEAAQRRGSPVGDAAPTTRAARHSR